MDDYRENPHSFGDHKLNILDFGKAAPVPQVLMKTNVVSKEVNGVESKKQKLSRGNKNPHSNRYCTLPSDIDRKVQLSASHKAEADYKLVKQRPRVQQMMISS